MATEVRRQLDAKLSGGPRPDALNSGSSLGQMYKLDKIKEMHEAMEVDEAIEKLKARGIKPTVVVEAD